MKATGIVRKVDDLGRVVVPIELRRTLNIDVKDALEIFVEGDKIVLKKYEPRMSCVVTGEVSNSNLSLAGGKIIVSQESAKEVLSELQKELQKELVNA